MTSYINLEQNSNIAEFTRYHHCGVPSIRQSHRSRRLVLQLLNRWQTNPHIGEDVSDGVREWILEVVLCCITTKIRLWGTLSKSSPSTALRSPIKIMLFNCPKEYINMGTSTLISQYIPFLCLPFSSYGCSSNILNEGWQKSHLSKLMLWRPTQVETQSVIHQH
jgi:hypothetical protein